MLTELQGLSESMVSGMAGEGRYHGECLMAEDYLYVAPRAGTTAGQTPAADRWLLELSAGSWDAHRGRCPGPGP